MAGSTHEEQQALFARDLGPRGSRSDVASADPGAELAPTAAAILGAIPSWWTAQASAAGLSGQWSAFIPRADGAAKRRLKDLAAGTFAWYADEPEHELAWYELA